MTGCRISQEQSKIHERANSNGGSGHPRKSWLTRKLENQDGRDRDEESDTSCQKADDSQMRREVHVAAVTCRTHPRAGTNELAATQHIPSREIMLPTLTLDVRSKWSAAVGAFCPGNPQPPQVFDHGPNKFRPTPLGIEIFVSENQDTVVL